MRRGASCPGYKTAIDSNGRGCRPGKAPAATGIDAAPSLLPSPGGAALARPAGRFPPGEDRVREALQCGCLCYLWLQRSLRSRLIVCVMSLMAPGAHRGGLSPPPLYPGLRPAKSPLRGPSTYPAGFGSGRGSVPAKHGPQPASMRAAPACRERLSDFEAVSTGSFSKKSE